LKENNWQPRLLNPAKVPFITEGEIKTFHVKKKTKKLKEFMTTKPEDT
jgi:hypothetical protein